METVTNITNAASKAIWGEPAKDTTKTSSEEPVSGAKGDVAAGEPYDAGNLDSTNTDKTTGLSGTTPSGTTTTTDAKPTGDNALSGPIDETGKTGVTLAPESKSGISTDKPIDSGEPSTGAKFSIGDNTTDAPKLVHDSKGTTDSTTAPTTSTTESKTEDKNTLKESLAHSGKISGTHKPLEDRTKDSTTTGASDTKPSTTSTDTKTSTSTPATTKDDDTSKDGKPSLKEKIKDKLHIHKH